MLCYEKSILQLSECVHKKLFQKNIRIDLIYSNNIKYVLFNVRVNVIGIIILFIFINKYL